MPTHRRPAKRLLIVPALLLAGILAIVIVVPGIASRPVDPLPQLDELPPIVGDVEVCSRGRHGTEAAAAPLPITGARVTSAMVVACPAVFDGLRVRYAGELIGDLLHRDGGAWVLVNDDEYALRHGPLPIHREYRGANSGLTVWVPTELLDEITGLGRPHQRGDVVVFDGHIRRTDPDDGGGLTLRADRLEVMEAAHAVRAPFDRPQAILAGSSLIAAALLWIQRRRSSR